MCTGLNARTCQNPRLKEEGSALSFWVWSEREAVEPGVVWEERGAISQAEKWAQNKEELRLEAGAWDQLARSTCVSVVGALLPLSLCCLKSVAWKGVH